MALNRRIKLIGIYRTAFLAPFIASVAAQGCCSRHFRRALRGRERAARQPRPSAPGLSRRSRPGAVRDRPDRYLGRDRVPAGDLPRRAPGRAAELVDAASVDGARRWATLRHVILPQLLPVTIFLVVWQTLLSLQLFDLVYATTPGTPGRDRCSRLLHLQPGVRALQRRVRGRGRLCRRPLPDPAGRRAAGLQPPAGEKRMSAGAGSRLPFSPGTWSCSRPPFCSRCR